MSVSAFHHHFKGGYRHLACNTSKTCACQARLMMLHDGLKAGVAADKVGYGSGSQFGRRIQTLL